MAKVKQACDTQRKQVYAWEDRLLGSDARHDSVRYDSLDELRAFVNKVLDDHGVSWAPWGTELNGRTFYADRSELVHWRSGVGPKANRGGACGWRGAEGALRHGRHPRVQWLLVSSKRWVVLHETAHLLCDQLGDVHAAGHGGVFMRTYIELLSKYLPTLQGRFTWLEKHARKARLRVSRSSILSPRWKVRPGEVGKPSNCIERPSDIIRRIARANPKAKFSEKVRLCVVEGVNPTTAEGVLVRFMRTGK